MTKGRPAGRPYTEIATKPGGSNSTHAQVLYLEEVLDAVFRAFAAGAGFLHAAEGGDLGGNNSGVDADDAVFDLLRHAPDAADVAAVEIGGEAELGVVGEADGVLLGLEAEERRHRPEGLLARYLHLWRHVHEDRRLEEAAAQGVALAAGD